MTSLEARATSPGRAAPLRLCTRIAGISACLLGAAASPALAAGRGEPGPVYPVEIMLPHRPEAVALLTRLGIDLDGVYFDRARAYVIAEEEEKLRGMGFDLERIPDETL